MANQEHIERLLASEGENNGMKSWNEWVYKDVITFGELSSADLSSINLSGLDLSGINLSDCNLRDALLTETELYNAILIGTDLSRAKLSGANLASTRISYANLTEANFRKTHLGQTTFDSSTVLKTNFLDSAFANTIMVNTDLSDTLNLDTARHIVSSSIAMNTIKKSKGLIPEKFLKGCGLSDADIAYAKLFKEGITRDEKIDISYEIANIMIENPIQLRPLFLSHTSSDKPFVRKLHERFDKDGQRAWLDENDLVAGPLAKQIHKRIDLHSIVILVLSKEALESDWVEHEIRRAAKRQKEYQNDNGKDQYSLFPIALDDSWKTHEWDTYGPVEDRILDMFITDFSQWEDEKEFEIAYQKLINGLKEFS